MSAALNFVLVRGSDWQALYYNGTMITQNHSITVADALRAMEGYRLDGHIEFSIKNVDDTWIEGHGFPQLLERINFG